jgi:drug/metabolite transporter (DMT)-like permease
LLVQHAMTVSGPMFFVGLRFAAAASIVALFSWRTLRDLTFFEFKAGAFIGVAIMLGYGLQTVGLQSPSSQSAFITALYVPFVPLLQWLVPSSGADAEHRHHAGFHRPDAAVGPGRGVAEFQPR